MKSESCSVVSDFCDPLDCSLPGSSGHEIFQARILKWVAISFSRRSSQPRDWTQVSHIVGRSFTVSLEEDGKCLCCSVVENALEVKWSRSVMSNSFFFFHVQLVASPWTVAHYAPLSMGFSRQEYWSGLPFPSPEDLPNPGIEPRDRTQVSHIVSKTLCHLSHQGSRQCSW